MAQVNIASLGELWAGTLSWTLNTSQTIYAYSSAGNTSISSWSGSSPWSGTVSVNIPSAGSNRMFFCFLSAQSANGGNFYNRVNTASATLNGVSLTKFDSSMWTADQGAAVILYGPAPTTGSQNLVISQSDGSYSLMVTYFTMYNVHQTAPFKTQIGGIGSGSNYQEWSNYSYTGYHNYSGTYDPSNNVMIGEKKSTGVPGDVGLLFRLFEYYAGTHSISNGTTSQDTVFHTLTHNNVWTAGGKAVYMSACPGNTTGTWTWSGSTTYNSGSTYDYNSYRLLVLNPAPPATPLFAVPTGYVVKVNQIYLGTGGSGLTASVFVDSLPASGADPQSIENNAGTDVITATGNDALANLVTGIPLAAGSSTKILTQPLWLTEGTNLKVATTTPTPTMYNSTTFSGTAPADCIVSMEVIKQSS